MKPKNRYSILNVAIRTYTLKLLTSRFVVGVESSRDETDAMAEWYRTPRIPEEPDVCDINKDMIRLVTYTPVYPVAKKNEPQILL